MVDMLREQGAQHIRVVVGGGGTISPAEIAELEAYGVAKIYTPEDGRRLGLDGMIDDVFARVARKRRSRRATTIPSHRRCTAPSRARSRCSKAAARPTAPRPTICAAR